MNVFFDSSSLAKRYLEEEGSSAVEEICAKADEIVVSMICLPEIISALNRKRREKTLSVAQYEMVKQRVLAEFEDFLSCPLTPEVIALAVGFMEKFPLRAMDALHLACAFDLRVGLFVSRDKRQLMAARKLKFKVYAA